MPVSPLDHTENRLVKCFRIDRIKTMGVVLALAIAAGAGCSNGPEPRGQTDVAAAGDVAGDGAQALGPDVNGDADDGVHNDAADETVSLRVATFNASLYRQSEGELVQDLAGGNDTQAKDAAELLQRVRPDIVLLNEFDWDPDGKGARLFAEEYLAVSQNGADPITYAHRHVPSTNTGVHSGVDLNGDGQTVSTPGGQGFGNDAFGFGTFPGQYGMVIFSRHPIIEQEVRTFQTLLWKEMPENLLPTDWYSQEAVDVFRLSSKNHVDVPVDINGAVVHILASHPTPPSFDGDEDRNGKRNHDEIRFWADYVSGGPHASYIRDDSGTSGGLDSTAAFVLLGDLNSDPSDGDSRHEAVQNLLGHARIHDPRPASEGAREASQSDGGANRAHQGQPGLDTADFGDARVGNLRVDYALPSANLGVEDQGVFWPAANAEHAELAGVSDHHAVWVDVTVAK